jgi:predicted nuclease of predicted toxin-antitoxin system
VKVKIDENLSGSHGRILAEAGHDVTDVHDEGLAGASDDDVWARVCDEDKLLVTLDHDFSDVRRFAPGTHPGILLLRTTHPSLTVVSQILHRVLREQPLETLARCLAVADETRTRIRRPGD